MGKPFTVWQPVPPSGVPFAEQMAPAVVGARITFREERTSYVVQARDERWIVCTKPFNLNKETIFYTIIDLTTGMRGPDNLVFTRGYMTPALCRQNLRDLQKGQLAISQRRQCPAYVTKITAPKPVKSKVAKPPVIADNRAPPTTQTPPMPTPRPEYAAQLFEQSYEGADPELFKRNPQAREFYMRGVRDYIIMFRELASAHVPPDRVSAIIENIMRETDPSANNSNTH